MLKTPGLFLFLSLLVLGMCIAKPISAQLDTTKHIYKPRYFDNGQLRVERYLIIENYNTDSVERIYYNTGQIMQESYWHNGEMIGPISEWYKNGQMKYRGKGYSTRKEGYAIAWYDNGQVHYEGVFDRNIFIGDRKYWHPNGNKMHTAYVVVIDNKDYNKRHHNQRIIPDVDTMTFMHVGKSISWHENGNKAAL